jgi:glycopeptide antibiotics resistance protein
MWEIILYINPLTVTAGILACFTACALAARFQKKSHETVARLALVVLLGIVLAATVVTTQGFGTGDHSVWLIPGKGLLFGNTMDDMEQSMYTRQQIANAAMFLPLGICFRFSFPSATLAKAVVAGCGLSLFIELAQWLINSGRVVDIDDVIVNTAGTLIGAALYTLANKMAPQQSSPTRVSPRHRRTVRH